MKQDGDSDLSPDCMLYVCNKWDNVEENEEGKVFGEIQSRLRRNGIEVREGQLLKLSIEKVKIFYKGINHRNCDFHMFERVTLTYMNNLPEQFIFYI